MNISKLAYITMIALLVILGLACGGGGGIGGSGDGIAASGGIGGSGTGNTNVVISGGATSAVSSGGVNIASLTDTKTILVNGPVGAVGSGNIKVFGLVLAIDSSSVLTDKSGAASSNMLLTDLKVGDVVETELVKSAGQLRVGALARVSSTMNWTIQGTANSSAFGSLNIEGISVLTTGTTVFTSSANSVITETVFYQALSSSNYIRAQGDNSSLSPLQATQVSFK